MAEIKKYVTKLNDYVVKDAEAHTRLDAVEGELANAGKIQGLKINDQTIEIGEDKVVNLDNYVARLEDGKVPAVQLPSYVDDVVEGKCDTNANKFYVKNEETGEYTVEYEIVSSKIYVDIDTNKTYRWSGSKFTEISESLALGETASTAFAGNRGAALEGAVDDLELMVDNLEVKDSFTNQTTDESGNVTGELTLYMGTGNGSGVGGTEGLYRNVKCASLQFGADNTAVLPSDMVKNSMGVALMISAYNTATQKIDAINVFLPPKGIVQAYHNNVWKYNLCEVTDVVKVHFGDNTDGTPKITVTVDNQNISVAQCIVMFFPQ